MIIIGYSTVFCKIHAFICTSLRSTEIVLDERYESSFYRNRIGRAIRVLVLQKSYWTSDTSLRSTEIVLDERYEIL